MLSALGVLQIALTKPARLRLTSIKSASSGDSFHVHATQSRDGTTPALAANGIGCAACCHPCLSPPCSRASVAESHFNCPRPEWQVCDPPFLVEQESGRQYA